MPSLKFVVIVLGTAILVGAGVGVVLGKRAAEARIQAVAKPDARTSRDPGVHESPKGAEAKPVKTLKQSGTPASAPENASDLVFVSRKDLVRVRNAANEAAAIATLRSVSSAQAQAQVSGAIDADGDQAGEYATFGELSGRVPCRAAPGKRSIRLDPPILGAAFAEVTESGNVLRSGYVYRMYLPGPTASNGKTAGIPESAKGGGPQPDANNSEILWSIYAWPIDAPTTGARAFFINQEGDLLATTNADGAYSGEDRAPAFDAAFSAGTPGDMAAQPVPGAKCNDGHVWSALDPGEGEIAPPAELGPATEADRELNARPESDKVVVSRSLLRRTNISVNEAHAIQMLRVISMAQAQVQAMGAIDTDEDSVGEYAYFAEMAGAVPFRASPGSKREVLEPAVLSAPFGKVSSAGNLLHSGYVFRIYLPGATAGGRVPGIAESGGGGAATQGAKPDHNHCEVLWSMYAWPIEAGTSGTRAFFVDQDGDVLEMPNVDGAYSGEARAPAFDAARDARRSGDMRSPLPESGAKGNDGQAWAPVS
jgi:hypothetical protein